MLWLVFLLLVLANLILALPFIDAVIRDRAHHRN